MKLFIFQREEMHFVKILFVAEVKMEILKHLRKELNIGAQWLFVISLQ